MGYARIGEPMLSRVADSLYWMSRYLERAENCARIIDASLNLMLDSSTAKADVRWRRVMACLGAEPEMIASDSDAILRCLTFDTTCRLSIVACVTAARENARQVRERITSEMWEKLNRLYHNVRKPMMMELWDKQPSEFLYMVKESAYLFQGVTDSTMTHAEGWQFIQLGRYIERALALANLIDVSFSGIEAGNELHEHLEWIGLLRTCSAFEPYIRVYTAEINPVRVAEFLLLNSGFPHSLVFSVQGIHNSLQAIADSTNTQHGRKLERLAGRLLASLHFAQIEELMGEKLHPFLTNVQKQCSLIHNEVHQVYIAYPVQSVIA